MSGDHLSEIDSILADDLGLDKDSDIKSGKSNRENIIELLQSAADELGKSPTFQEFNSLDLEISADIVKHEFGTWNEAKRAAGLETWQRGMVRNINENYFQSIDSAEKAYWFGSVFATSSLQLQPKSENYSLQLGRTEDKAYFITQFSKDIESDYPIHWYNGKHSAKRQAQLQISNPTFIEYLLDAGYPDIDDEQNGFPQLDDENRATFLRGFLESSGYFSTQGWQVTVANIQRAETLHEWFEQLGAKRPTISETSSEIIVVHVSNTFDIKAIFESLWPNLLETEPSWKPYPKKVLQYLESEYPYPENLSYLDG